MNYAQQTQEILGNFFAAWNIAPGQLIVLGISTSEIAGSPIGKNSHAEIGEEVLSIFLSEITRRGADLAVQCCEHLNRALVMERKAALARGYEIVQVIPQPKAGGSGATAAYQRMEDPVIVESVRAEAGIDIGVTMIAMHLKPVVIPVRTTCKLGEARVDFATTRPKLIGGERARYT